MVQNIKTNSSNELYNNLNDDSRVYDIEANINIADGVMNNVDSGVVKKNGVRVANFNWWDENRLNITYQGVDVAERNDINVAVDTFVKEVKNEINGEGMKQIEVLNAYRILGEAKMTTLEVSEVVKVVKARKAMRPTAEALEAFVNDMQEKAAAWESMTDEQRSELNKATNEELTKAVDVDFEKLSEESVAKLIQENGFKTREIDLLDIMV